MKTIYIKGVGLLAAGLESWESGKDILAGKAEYEPDDVKYPAPDILPANERRRTSKTIRLALKVASEALASCNGNISSIPSIFSSSNGDGEIMDKMFTALSREEKVLSPTVFHNSVHNASAGYWSIGIGSRESSSSISSGSNIFATSLIEAASQIWSDCKDRMMAVYDTAMPNPLYECHPMAGDFGSAFLLSGKSSADDMASLDFELTDSNSSEISVMDNPVLEKLRSSNPSASGLPLLMAIAKKENRHLILEFSRSANLIVEVS